MFVRRCTFENHNHESFNNYFRRLLCSRGHGDHRYNRQTIRGLFKYTNEYCINFRKRGLHDDNNLLILLFSYRLFNIV